MRLDPETYWKISLAIAWTDRSSRAAADADVVRASLSGPRDDLSGILREAAGVREAFDRLMQRAAMASSWSAYSGKPDLPIFSRSLTLRDVPVDDLSKPGPLLCRLSEAREAIERELAMFDNSLPSGRSLTILAMLSALEAAGRIPAEWISKNRMQIGHAEMFRRSATLRRIVKQNLEDPAALVHELAAHRSTISSETREEMHQDKGRGEHTIATLVSAAMVSEPLLNNGQTARRHASAYDLYLRSPTLQATDKAALANDKALLKFLLARRDKIAIECLKAMGKLDDSAYTFSGAESHYSLHTLVEALYIAGRIDKTMATRLVWTAVGPLEYYLANRDSMPELDRIAGMNRDRTPNNAFDRTRFTHSKDDSKTLSDEYIGRVFRWARWFYHDPDIVTRSIYGADELPSLMLRRRGIGPLEELLLPKVRDEILAAARDAEHEPIAARSRAFRALGEMVAAGKMPEAKARLSRDEKRVLNLIDRLVRWNSDALAAPAGKAGASRNSLPGAGLPGATFMFMPVPSIFTMSKILRNA